MKKWTVRAEFTIQAENRRDAWAEAREWVERHARGLIDLTSIPYDPLSDPEQWIALNEPIKAQR